MKLKKILAGCLALSMVTAGMPMLTVNANYQQSFYYDKDTFTQQYPLYECPGADAADQPVYLSDATVSNMMQAIQDADKENGDSYWLDRMLGREGAIPDFSTSSDVLYSRGRGLYMRSHNASSLGFVGDMSYGDSLYLTSNKGYAIELEGNSVREDVASRKNYPSHSNNVFTGSDLTVNSNKFITYNNSAVTILEITNNGSADKSFNIVVTSDLAQQAEGNELVGSVQGPKMNQLYPNQGYVDGTTDLDIRIAATDATASGSSLTTAVSIPAGQTIQYKVIMGVMAEEIPESYTEYEAFRDYDADTALSTQLEVYNQWWADNIPYVDLPNEYMEKVVYYRFWASRFNLQDLNIPGNDWQFPAEFEGVLGYNNVITVSVPWLMQDLKYFRTPLYAYGTWAAQGEISGNQNYQNNPGRPGVWTWDMMQYTTYSGLEDYLVHGGSADLLEKFAQWGEGDVYGSFAEYGATDAQVAKGWDEYLMYYGHPPITGNDNDNVSAFYKRNYSNGSAGNVVNGRVDGSSTVYANTTATAELYRLLAAATDNAEYADKAAALDELAGNIQNSVLTTLWTDDFSNKNGDTGHGSFLHQHTGSNTSSGITLNPWRDNVFFPFEFNLVPTQGEDNYDAKYIEMLNDYDSEMYPVFPFFTADQVSIEEKKPALDAEFEEFGVNYPGQQSGKDYGSNNFAFCNGGNYVNMLSSALRYYPTEHITADTYERLMDWMAFTHYVKASGSGTEEDPVVADASLMDSEEFFWFNGYFDQNIQFPMDGPEIEGNLTRAWIHNNVLGMMNFSVFEDIAGLQPRADEKIELWPVGVSYDHYAVDNVRYHDRDISIVWQDPDVYTNDAPEYEGIPVGYSLYVGDKLVANVSSQVHLVYDPATGEVEFPENIEGAVGTDPNAEVWYSAPSDMIAAIDVDFTATENTVSDTYDANDYVGQEYNNDRVVELAQQIGVDLENPGSENLALTADVSCSFADVRDLAMVNDGTTVSGSPGTSGNGEEMNRMAALFNQTPNDTDYIQFDFDGQKTVDTVKLYFFNDRKVGGYCEPSMYIVQYKDPETGEYVVASNQNKSPALPQANYNNDEFTEVTTDSIRIVFTHKLGYNTAVKEIQIFDNDVTVEEPVNQAPVADAGSYDPINLDSTLTLMGSASDDGLPTGNLYPTWSVVDAPEGGEAEFSDANAFTTDVTFTEQGEYTLQLEVSDGELASVSTTIVTVDAVRDIYNAAFYATPSASYTNSDLGGLATMNDGYEPASHDDKSHGAWHDWGQEGKDQWVQYSWEEPVTIDSTEIYFFNDNGGISEPKSYTIQYLDDEGNWVDVPGASGFGVVKGAFNKTTFDKITTTALRVNMVANLGLGIIEWRVHSTTPMEFVSAYIDDVTATAGNNSNDAVTAANLVDKSGLVGSGFEAMHENTNWMAQWNTGYLGEASAPTEETAWVKFDLKKNYKIGEMGIWNYGFTPTSGLNNITVWYSKDDKNYEKLGDYTLEQAPASTGAEGEATIPAQIIDMAGTEARYVKITYSPVSGEGNFGSTYFGLSEVMFKKSTAVSSLEPASVTTVVGAWPKLPETVTANCDDGTTKELPVTWDESEIANKITVATQFSITGEVEGTSLKASCVISVIYDKSGLKQLLDTIESGNINEVTYEGTEEQWDAFYAALENAKKVYANASATQDAIDSAQSDLREAFEALTPSSNPAFTATASSNYTAGWNNVAAVNDGVLSDSSAIPPGNNQGNVYGNWGVGRDVSIYVQYTWEQAVTLTGSSVYFFDDRGTGNNAANHPGVAVPDSYTYQYLNSDGEWVTIEGTGFGTERDAFNETVFNEPVTTTALRINMVRQATEDTADGYAQGDTMATGIIEWMLTGEGAAEAPDKSELNEAILAAQGIENNDNTYTPGSWEVFQTALEQAEKVYDNAAATEADIAEALKALTDAQAALAHPADRTDLEETLAEAEKLTAEDLEGYTPSSVEAFQTALAEAKAVNENLDATQEQVNEAIANLGAAMNGLVPVGNKGLLEKTYEYALTLDTEGVTDSAKAYFVQVMAEAKAVLDNPDATQEMVDTAWDNLLEGIWGLGLVQGDKTMLEQLIAKADSMVENAGKYVQTNWSQLVDALDAAKKVMDDGDAMDSDIEPVADALLNAILAQRFKADKSILEELVNKAEAMDVSGYSLESVQVFSAALYNARTVLADATLSIDDQAVVDQAVNELNNAIENLSADSGTEVPDDENTPSGNEGEDNTDSAQGNNSASDNTANNSSKTEGTQSNGNSSASSNNAQTGDNNMVLPVAVATAAAALVAASALVLVRRKRENG